MGYNNLETAWVQEESWGGRQVTAPDPIPSHPIAWVCAQAEHRQQRFRADRGTHSLWVTCSLNHRESLLLSPECSCLLCVAPVGW